VRVLAIVALPTDDRGANYAARARAPPARKYIRPGQGLKCIGRRLLAFVEPSHLRGRQDYEGGCSRSAPAAKLEEMAKKLEASR